MLTNSRKARNIYMKYGIILFYFYMLYSYVKYRINLTKKMYPGWYKNEFNNKYLRIVDKKDMNNLNLKNISNFKHNLENKEDIYPLN